MTIVATEIPSNFGHDELSLLHPAEHVFVIRFDVWGALEMVPLEALGGP